jgi:LuxR family transcriptional regulator, regulator of acetate metabolism
MAVISKAGGARAARRSPARSAALEARVVSALERTGALLGWEPWDGARSLVDHEDQGHLDLVCEVVAERIKLGSADLRRSELTLLCELLVELEGLRAEQRDLVMSERYAALTGVQAGLGRLRGIGSVSTMLDKACEEVCRACGFDRSILFQVVDSQMVAVSVYSPDAEQAAAILEAGRANPRHLDHMLLETEMVRRRAPMLVLDAQADPRVHQDVASASGSFSYVAAPIMPEGRVIGFLHADRFHQRRPMDEFDRDMLWMFAEGFGYAYERTVLLERLRAQRDQVRAMIGSTEQLVNELCDTEVAVSRVDRADPAQTGQSASMLTNGPSRLDQLLTRREIEVVNLMAAGETNAGIAARLVISEGTVKSHVKHVLRKLRAANRAEAVSRYLRIKALDQGA